MTIRSCSGRSRRRGRGALQHEVSARIGYARWDFKTVAGPASRSGEGSTPSHSRQRRPTGSFGGALRSGAPALHRDDACRLESDLTPVAAAQRLPTYRRRLIP